MITQETLKQHLGGIQTKLSMETVEPFVKSATNWFRRQIGRDLLSYVTLLSVATERTDVETELVEVTQSCICWQAFDLALPHLKLRVGDLGVFKQMPRDTAGVAKWEYMDSKESIIAMLDNSLEDFWELLEELAPKAWTSSTEYQARQGQLIRSAYELSQHVPAVARRSRFFDQLRPYMIRAEKLYLIDFLTEADYDALKAAAVGGTLTGPQRGLLECLRPALANFTLFEALPHLPLNLAPTGLSEKRDKSGLYEEVAPDGALRDNLRRQFLKDGQKELGLATTYLKRVASAVYFPAYYAAATGNQPLSDMMGGPGNNLVIL